MPLEQSSGRAAPGRRPPRLHNIQYLRAVAAIGVAAYHAGAQTGVRFDVGALGVDVFFVISGFLMVLITNAESRAWPFLRDRLVRVVPLYWLATVATFLSFGRSTTGGASVADDLIASFLFIPWGEQADAPWFFPVLNVGWTLNYEMLFYLMFAACLFFPRRCQLAVLAGLFLALVLLRLTPLGTSLPWRFWGNPIVIEFLVGAVLAALWRRRGNRALAASLIPIAAGALALIQLTAYSHEGFKLFVASALIIAAVVSEKRRQPWRVPLLLGDASYSIYLWHYLAIVTAAAVLGKGTPALLLFPACLASGIALGLAAHLVIERPLLAAMRSRNWKRGAPNPGGV